MITVPLDHSNERAVFKLRNVGTTYGTAGQAATGVPYTAVSASWFRRGVSVNAIDPTAAHTAVSDSHTDLRWFEVDATEHPGLYTLDIPDTVWASQGHVFVSVVVTDVYDADLFYDVVHPSRLQAEQSMDYGTVTNTFFTPTTTEFRADGTLSSLDNAYAGKSVLWVGSGNLQSTMVSIVSYTASTKHFVTSLMPTVPSNGEAFITL